MTTIPPNYDERVYAGILGKIIGSAEEVDLLERTIESVVVDVTRSPK